MGVVWSGLCWLSGLAGDGLSMCWFWRLLWNLYMGGLVWYGLAEGGGCYNGVCPRLCWVWFLLALWRWDDNAPVFVSEVPVVLVVALGWVSKAGEGCGL